MASQKPKQCQTKIQKMYEKNLANLQNILKHKPTVNLKRLRSAAKLPNMPTFCGNSWLPSQKQEKSLLSDHVDQVQGG